jgi:mannose-6-phosphate isomerase-like protein (cupin superfamily)
MSAGDVVSLLVRHRGQGGSFWVLGDHYTFKLSSEETMGSLAVVELTAFPQNGPPPHIHHREDESFYILNGTFSVLVGHETFDAAAGAFVHIPKGTLHTYKNIEGEPGRLLVILTPGGFENLWREIGEPAQQDSTPPAPPKGIIEKLMALAPQYHLEIPPPPKAQPGPT